jgi:hypothetical protein
MYYNHQYKGFFAVKITKDSHVAENFAVSRATTLTPYPSNESTAESRTSMTAPYFCDVQLTTTAGQRGSLERSDACSAIAFDESRPAVWDIPFPLSNSSMSSILVQLSDCGYNQCQLEAPAPAASPPTADEPSGGETPSESGDSSKAVPNAITAFGLWALLFIHLVFILNQ